MKKILFAVSILIFSSVGFAHGGRTDGAGGHNCNIGSCAGTYHFHNSGTTGYRSPYSAPKFTTTPSYSTPSYSTPSYSSSTTTSCPLFASYDYSKGGCYCNSGYVVETNSLGKQSCVSAALQCLSKYGLFSQYNSITKNCECDSGYSIYEGSCQSMDSICQDQFGYNSEHSSGTSCVCRDGYEWNSSGTSCIYKFEEVRDEGISSLSQSEINRLVELLKQSNETNEKKCGENSFINEFGTCACEDGYMQTIIRGDNLNCQLRPTVNNKNYQPKSTSLRKYSRPKASENNSSLKIGMTQDEVKATMGYPERLWSFSGKDFWRYDKNTKLTFENKMLISW